MHPKTPEGEAEIRAFETMPDHGLISMESGLKRVPAHGSASLQGFAYRRLLGSAEGAWTRVIFPGVPIRPSRLNLEAGS